MGIEDKPADDATWRKFAMRALMQTVVAAMWVGAACALVGEGVQDGVVGAQDVLVPLSLGIPFWGAFLLLDRFMWYEARDARTEQEARRADLAEDKHRRLATFHHAVKVGLQAHGIFLSDTCDPAHPFDVESSEAEDAKP